MFRKLPPSRKEVLITTSADCVFTANFEEDSNAFSFKWDEHLHFLPIKYVKAWIELP